MQSTATTPKLRTGLALALAVTVLGSSPALAAQRTDSDGKASPKIERITSKGGTKSAPSSKSLRAVKRQLKQAGMQSGHGPGSSKKMRRGFCTFTFYSDGVIAECTQIGGAYGWYTDVWVDFYNDYNGWIYWGWYL